MATARDLITKAYRVSGLVAIRETPDDNEINRGLEQLNGIIDTWNSESLIPYSNTELTENFIVGQGSYSIGPSGADFTGTRPIEILGIQVKISDTLIPLRSVTNIDWQNSYVNESPSGRPEYYRYNATNPNGTIEVNPQPGTAYEIRISYKALLTSYALNDTIALPVGYESALEYALAAMLGGIEGVINPFVIEQASARKERIQTRNVEPPTLSLNGLPIGSNDRYDITTDQVRGNLG